MGITAFNKTVSLGAFKPILADEMETKITEFAKGKGMSGDIIQWGGRGDALPFFVVVCTPSLADALKQEHENGFLKGCAFFVQDYAPEVPKPRTPSP